MKESAESVAGSLRPPRSVSRRRPRFLTRTKSKARDGGPGRITVIATRVLVILVILALWQLIARNDRSILPLDAVSRPTMVVSALVKIIGNGVLAQSFAHTFLLVVVSVVVSAPVGIAAAILMLVPPIGWLFRPTVAILYSIPKVALIPIFILLFGIGVTAHAAAVISGAAFVYFYSAAQGLDELDQHMMSSLYLMGASRWKVLRTYVLPSMLPQLIGATRVAVPLALAIEIFAELEIPTGTPGLGVLLANDMGSTGNTAAGMAVLIFVVTVAYILDVILERSLASYTRSIGQGAK